MRREKRMQTKRHSLLESCMNVISGMAIAFTLSQVAHEFQAGIRDYIWSGFEWNISAGTNIVMTIILTIVSVVRGYMWRRYFNGRTLNETN